MKLIVPVEGQLKMPVVNFEISQAQGVQMLKTSAHVCIVFQMYIDLV
jgi:hypothetical protein